MIDLKPSVALRPQRRYLVFGLGRSGLASACALQQAGAKVIAWDDASDSQNAAKAKAITLRNPLSEPFEFDSLVLSPGIPLTHPCPHPVVKLARDRKVEIICDVELLFHAQTLKGGEKPTFIGITGTNGKSTTTALIAHLLNHCGKRVAAGGNLGLPALDMPELGRGDSYVLELSSYQLDLCHDLACDHAILLNMSPDHLERHGSMKCYRTAKARLFQRQDKGQTAFISLDDDHSRLIFDYFNAKGRQEIIPLSVENRVALGLFALQGELWDDRFERKDPQNEAVRALDLKDLPTLVGKHNQQNALAAYGIGRAMGLTCVQIHDALKNFQGLAHRQEKVLDRENLLVINDSKATNADAAARGLASYRNIYWLAGGLSKEPHFSRLKPLLPKVRQAYFYGDAAPQLQEDLQECVQCRSFPSFHKAVEQAAKDAAEASKKAKAVLLFSPACASFDLFPDFEARGNIFKDLIKQCVGGKE